MSTKLTFTRLTFKIIISVMSVFASCCGFTSSSSAQEAITKVEPQLSVPSTSQVDVSKINQKNEKSRESEIASFLEARQQSLQLLWPLLNSQDNQVQCSAAYLLGEGRYEEVCLTLSQMITLQDSKFPRPLQRLWSGGQYPAAEALVTIGKPSIFFMLNNLATSDDALVRDLSLKVIRSIEGVDVAQFILERAVDREKDGGRKAKLQVAIAALPNIKSGVKPGIEALFPSISNPDPK